MRIQIFGAGCLGLSAALALDEQGHDVEVVDPRRAGSTAKAAGIVSTMTWNDDDFHLVQRTRGRIGELIAEAAMDGPARVWKSMDSLAIAAGRGLSHMDDVQRRLERLGEEPERLDAEAMRSAYPMLVVADGEEGLVAQEDGCVEPGDLMDLLQWTCQQAGIPIRASSKKRPQAKVIAAGPWTSQLVPELPLACFRAQLASIGFSPDIPMVHDTVHGMYLRPESATSILAGNGTRLWPHDPDDYDEAADPGFREHVATGLVDRVQDAGEAIWRKGWAGLCVGTPDRHPVCGLIPGNDDRYVLSGDNGYGIMRCLALGERLADAVDGTEHEATSPSRFAGFDSDWELQEGFAW